jgi:hypothetical protein
MNFGLCVRQRLSALHKVSQISALAESRFNRKNTCFAAHIAASDCKTETLRESGRPSVLVLSQLHCVSNVTPRVFFQPICANL